MTGMGSVQIGRSPLSKVPIFVMKSGSLLIIRSRIFTLKFFEILVGFFVYLGQKMFTESFSPKTKTKFIARERGHVVRPVYVWKVKITSVNSVDRINSLEDFSINDCRAVIIYGVSQVKVSFPGRRTFIYIDSIKSLSEFRCNT